MGLCARRQEEMASLPSNQHEDAHDLNKLALTLTSLTCSSTHHLAQYKSNSCDSMSRSLDTSLAHCTDHIVNPHNPTTNPSSRDAIRSTHSTGDKNLEMVPFKWEEAPGKPINTSSCNDLVPYKSSCLQLPPKLQCQGNQSPLHVMQRNSFDPKPPAIHHESPPVIKKLGTPINQSHFKSSPNKEILQSHFKSSPNKETLKRLCTYMLKTASCTGQTTHHKFISHSWHTPPCIEITSTTLHHQYKQQAHKPSFNDRFFFDRSSPKDLRHCASMDSILPVFGPSDTEDEFVSRKALTVLAMEEHDDAESTASSPWQPLSFHERESSSYWSWQSTTMKANGRLREDEYDDDDDDDGFHDFFSTSSSMKRSIRTDCDVMESACSSPSRWYFDFSPEDEEEHVDRKGSKLMVRLVALIKLKRVISKFKRLKEGAKHQVESTIWSPTLATYLYNEKEEEIQKISQSESSPILKQRHGSSEEDDGGHSEMGSNRLHIDPNYYLPSTIKTHLMHPECKYYSDEEESSEMGSNRLHIDPNDCLPSTYLLNSDCDYHSAEEKSSEMGSNRLHIDPNYFLPSTIKTHVLNSECKYYSDKEESSYLRPEEEAERQKLDCSRERFSLREQLSDLFEDKEEYYPAAFVPQNGKNHTLHPDAFMNKAAKAPLPCKEMCKVRQTVKVLASTIKLILVHTETRKRKL